MLCLKLDSYISRKTGISIQDCPTAKQRLEMTVSVEVWGPYNADVLELSSMKYTHKLNYTKTLMSFSCRWIIWLKRKEVFNVG